MKNWSMQKKLIVITNMISMFIMFGLGVVILNDKAKILNHSLESKMTMVIESLGLSTKALFWNFDNASLEALAKQIQAEKEVDYIFFLNEKKKSMFNIPKELLELEKGHDLFITKEVKVKDRVVGHIKLGYNKSENKKALTAALIKIVTVVIAGQVILSIAVAFLVRRLSKELEKNIESLKDTSIRSKESSEKLRHASELLSSSSNEQASAIQETVATLDEISAMVKTSATNASDSSERADESYQVTVKGKESIGELANVINMIIQNNQKIKEQMDENSQNLDSISSTINEISTKTSVINDIVFQTKLLSFNASVEAARAGESGKGFAVVAEEVGNLATMSGKASQEISEMLASSTDKVESIAKYSKEQIEKIVAEGDRQMDLVSEIIKTCEDSFDQVVSNVSEVKEMMNQVASAVSEQSVGVENITQAMNELDSTVQENTRGAQETYGHAENLSTQSELLDRIVESLFKTVNGNKKKSGKSKESLLQFKKKETKVVRDKKAA
ncbi:methyl-accepting chemotaxis protein [Halobacteriovorax sp. GB3]|uniref:methyl-accepting chemotaxis protein n=1 Tax=Halobacteriovorax sp. GB3 TaxID=2719615 RepID=UPI00235E7B19|nr:methyl-accepting chemotaxis protein [Halobacteriovorax sp. GB3]MDD0852041.1 methyl-accepting chemotaxis protein [Halobacteriovorax sp. GB3]